MAGNQGASKGWVPIRTQGTWLQSLMWRVVWHPLGVGGESSTGGACVSPPSRPAVPADWTGERKADKEAGCWAGHELLW